MSSLRDLRYKLQKRVQRLQSVEAAGLSLELVRFFDFFDSQPTLRASAATLSGSYPNISEELNVAAQQGNTLEGLTEAESAAIGLAVLRRVAVPDDPRMPFIRYCRLSTSIDETLNRFREKYLNPFYEYIDETIDDRNLILAELIRFKHLAEWFRRGRLWDLWKNDTQSGERSLAFAVYEFLYEQGIDFHIEPASASGEADLVGAQDSAHPLVADVKIFDPDSSRGSSYIKRGLHQVYRYLQDFNQSIGYLVVFKGSEKQLEVNVPRPSADEAPCFALGDKSIFLVQIDIFPHEKSASKRPIPDNETISETEMLSEIDSK